MPVYRGWNAELRINGYRVGYAEEVRFSVDHSLEYYYAVGSRSPTRIYEGPISIEGSFRRAWIDKTYLQLLTGTGTLSELEIKVIVGAQTVTLSGCKLSRGSIEVPQDGILSEDYEFRALTISVA